MKTLYSITTALIMTAFLLTSCSKEEFAGPAYETPKMENGHAEETSRDVSYDPYAEVDPCPIGDR